MSLLMPTSVFALGRRRQSSPKWCRLCKVLRLLKKWQILRWTVISEVNYDLCSFVKKHRRLCIGLHTQAFLVIHADTPWTYQGGRLHCIMYCTAVVYVPCFQNSRRAIQSRLLCCTRVFLHGWLCFACCMFMLTTGEVCSGWRRYCRQCVFCGHC